MYRNTDMFTKGFINIFKFLCYALWLFTFVT